MQQDYRSHVYFEYLAFVGMGAKVHLILDSDTVCTAGGTLAQCPPYVYVPAALVDAYKSATNWSANAAKFRALEDYTVDGTISGDLDDAKI